jgi:hypothetical protein
MIKNTMKRIKAVLKLFVPPVFGKIAGKITRKKGFEFKKHILDGRTS